MYYIYIGAARGHFGRAIRPELAVVRGHDPAADWAGGGLCVGADLDAGI